MKKILSLSLTLALAFSLAACSGTDGASVSEVSEEISVQASTAESAEASAQAETETAEEVSSETPAQETSSSAAKAPESVTIKSLNANREEVDLEVPYDAQRIAVLDMASLDILDALGLGDRVVGSAGTSLDYLQDYVTDENISNLGTIKEADLEEVMACGPDVIFIGGRLSSSYDALSEIAPVVFLSTDTEIGVVESVRKNAETVASMFGLEESVDSLMADFDARIEALAEFAKEKTAIVGMCTSGSFNVLGNDGRCSLIGVEIGFENIGVDANIDTSTHGNEASFEFIVEKAPEYIFVMDRDAAIGTEGAQLAREIMENELVMGTDAYKNGNIVYLEHPAVWYTAEGGVTALDYMLSDLENALFQNR
ncbi:MAG TPA: ABC transporter substrate-binding protein [Candidatus Eisenbergiella merdigallinarum]|uniref:ABC transporter substrate-binding protein n=1 Tax=Candidatus Eisenbergiella merdigallinarum TaxID=2838552 RepID=A0A9D2MUP6_9FIRM|nr:ABC transporter substrate-binding protein [Candidatus Eisenbergiella merdigallinarum]